MKVEISPPAPPPPTPVLSPRKVDGENVDNIVLEKEEDEEEEDLAESLKRLRQKIIEHDAVVSPSKETVIFSEEIDTISEEIRDDVIAAKRRLRDAMSRKAMFGVTVALKKLEALVGSNDPDVKEGRCMMELFEINEEEKELKHKGERRMETSKELPPSPVVSVASTSTSLSTILNTKQTLLKKLDNAKTKVPRRITTYRDAVDYVSQQAKIAPDSKPRNTWTVSEKIRRRRFKQRNQNDDSNNGADWDWIEKKYSEIENETY